MWYARRHKQDATAGGGYGSEAKAIDRLRMQLQKTREGLVNLLTDVDEALRERRAHTAVMAPAGLNGGGDARTGQVGQSDKPSEPPVSSVRTR